MRKKYEDMSKNELIEIAKRLSIKGRHKMKKEDLIKVLKKGKKPLKEIRAVEEGLKVEIKKRKLEDHIELLPKEPGMVYVDWQIDEKNLKAKEGELRLYGNKKEILSIPVNIATGKGYMRVEEGVSLVAVIGTVQKKIFKPIISSESIVVPRGSPSGKNLLKWGKTGSKKGKVIKKNIEVSPNKAMEKEKKKLEEEARNIKYLRYPKD
jgi:hypothetical protein